ncbi:MAG: OmpA family protein [Bacteroidales bacterium]
MKRVLILTMMVAFLFAFSDRAPAQVTKTVKNVEKKIGNTIEKEIGNLFKKKKSAEVEKKDTTEKPAVAGTEKDKLAVEQAKPALSWAKYDFVPGDKIIFEDNLEGEVNGEFPSRWDLRSGNVEIAELDGANVIMMRSGHPEIIPYLKNPEIDYLPDVFTIEFDFYYPGDGMFQIYLYDRKNQKMSGTGYTYLDVRYDEIIMGQVRSKYPDKTVAKSRWMHIAIAYNRGQLKAYMDEIRLINIPHLDFNPSGLSLYTYHAGNDNIYYIKNFRIAEGGVKYYDRFLQDGKIVSNGIRFDVGKATLRPESMGVLNEIYKMLAEHPDINVSIEGHTDSDGDDAFNQTLSEQRAATVLSTLTGMGIDSDRLTSKGWGETMPLDNNSTPEGKANNRRVEFVKK